mgnify:CR=1 FL=1
MNNQIKTIELFRTKDLVLASVLYTYGQKLDGTEIENGGQMTFIFEDKPVCEDLISKHYSGDLSLPTRQLLDAFKTLKSIIFNS